MHGQPTETDSPLGTLYSEWVISQTGTEANTPHQLEEGCKHPAHDRRPHRGESKGDEQDGNNCARQRDGVRERLDSCFLEKNYRFRSQQPFRNVETPASSDRFDFLPTVTATIRLQLSSVGSSECEAKGHGKKKASFDVDI